MIHKSTTLIRFILLNFILIIMFVLTGYTSPTDSVMFTKEVQKLLATDPEENNCFGKSVAISEDYTIVGATGCISRAAYIFR